MEILSQMVEMFDSRFIHSEKTLVKIGESKVEILEASKGKKMTDSYP